MNFDISDEQKMLAEQVGRLLAERTPPARLRELIDAGAQWDEPLWRELAEMGALAVSIPEEQGGLGLDLIDLCVVAQELGRANAAVPFISSIGLAAELLRLFGDDAQKGEWLPLLATGEKVATLAFAEGMTDIWTTLPQCRFAEGTVTGTLFPVADLAIADIALVACQADGRPAFALVDLSAGGIAREAMDSFDLLRSHGRLTLDRAPASLISIDDEAAFQALLDRFAILLAFEQIGGAEACLYMARDYAMERRIFSRPLASYQAIKHKLADIFVLIELARSNAYYASWAAANGAADLASAAAAARLAAIDAFEQAARENIQVHGGIGYTFEADCHFYYRRERLLAVMLGGRARWSARLIGAVASAASPATLQAAA